MKIKPQYIIIIFFVSIFSFGFYKTYQSEKQKEANEEFQRTIDYARLNCQDRFDSIPSSSLPDGYSEEWCALFIENLKFELRKDYEKKGVIIDPNL
jgi:hypothetical protein